MNSKSVVAVFALFLLAGCAGTPTGPQVASTKRAKCEQSTGSLLCTNEGDENVVGPGSLNDSGPRSNATQSGLSVGTR